MNSSVVSACSHGLCAATVDWEAELPRAAYLYLSAKHHNPEAVTCDNRQRSWKATVIGGQNLAASPAAAQQPASRKMAIKFHCCNNSLLG